MTITFQSGRRIQGLSTDTVPAPTFSDDFSSYADQAAADAVWVPIGTGTKVNITNDNIGWAVGTNSCNHDVGFVVSNTWLLTCKITVNSIGTGDGTLWIILSNNATANHSTAQNYIGANLYDDGNECYCVDGFGISPAAPNSTPLAPSVNPSVTTYYVKITRNSSTSATVTFYSDSSYTTVLGTATRTVSASINDLRYIRVMYGNSGQMAGIVDDLKFYNGVTSVTSKPTNAQTQSRFEETDTETMYYLQPPSSVTLSDDFSSYADQTSANNSWVANTPSASNQVNLTNDNLDWYMPQSNAGGTNYSIAHDFGAGNISNTAWVLRFKLRLSSLSGANYIFIALTANSQSTPWASGALDYGIGLAIYANATGSYLTYENNEGFGSIYGSNLNITWATATDYYVEIKRTSSTTTTINIFSDSNYSILLKTQNETIPNITTLLRYFSVKNTVYTGFNGSQQGIIDDIKLYNGITSVATSTYWSAQQ